MKRFLLLLVLAMPVSAAEEPTFDQLLNMYNNLGWFLVTHPTEGQFACVKKDASDMGDRIINKIVEKAKKGVCT